VSCLVKKLWFSKLFNMYIVCMFLPFVVNKDEYKKFVNSMKQKFQYAIELRLFDDRIIFN